MGRIADDTIDAIRDRVDLVDLVGRHVALRQIGRSFKGLCPFHSEKTPSFHVHPERQIFHCFGCGAGGDLFGFVMRQENLTFPEAVRVLGRECGIEVQEGEASGLAERLHGANDVAQRLYRSALASRLGEAARAYLERRGIDAPLAERFGLGFAPQRWDALVRALGDAGVPTDLAVQAGLLAERASGGAYDRLRGRIVFPIRDLRGRIVGFGARALAADQEPKYLNTSESPVFRKREAFYGFPDALAPIRRAGRAVVVEGYFDLLALHRAGVEEVLATCGTALTAEHARNLRRRTRDVVLLFDGDEAGERAVERALEFLLPEGLRVRTGALPPGSDPDSFLASEGADALVRLVEGAPPALERVIRRAVARGCSTPWEKADAVAAVVPLIAQVPDPVERGEYARRLALFSDTRVPDVDAAVRRALRSSRSREEEPAAAAMQSGSGAESRCAERLARLVIEHPAQAARLDPEELSRLIPTPPWDVILLQLVQAARAGRVDLPALVEAIGPEAGPVLLAAVVSDAPELEEADAARVISDTVERLRERRRSEERRATTRRLSADPAANVADFLAAKQRQLEERRASLGLRPRPAPKST